MVTHNLGKKTGTFNDICQPGFRLRAPMSG